jgi:hypothetical protein
LKVTYLCKTGKTSKTLISGGMMKAKTVKSKKTDSWVLPGDPITLDEFRAGIKKAEKGPFITLDELKKDVEVWKKNQNL